MVNKEKTCRCCLLEAGGDNTLYEFSSEVAMNEAPMSNQEFVKIGHCFTFITSIPIEQDEEDNSKICSECLGDLKCSYLFQKKCLESEKIYSAVEEEEEYECKDDSWEVYSQDYIEEHIEETNDEDTNEDFESKYEENEKQHKMDEEEEIVVERQNFSCEMCPKTFDQKENYKKHFRRSHLKQALEESGQLEEDGKLSTNSRLLCQCDICGKINISQEEHENHMLQHEKEARYKCRKCDEKFSSKKEARDHLNAAHLNDEKTFVCDTCSKAFKNRYQLILHTRSHTGEKPFECQICNRCFSMSSNLQKHLDTHSTEKPYSCSFCNQSFKTQRSLKFHTVCYHQPEVKVKCPACDKSFVNKSYLKMHMQYHTGEKNFTCSLCHSKYYKTSHLKRHIQNVHLKLRLMKCDFCTSDFVRKETYKAHVISHHKSHMTEQEFDDVMEKIKKFQPPSLDVSQFILERQKPTNAHQVIVGQVEGDTVFELEMADEDNAAIEYEDIKIDNNEEYYEEAELCEDEQ
ncbi:CLUMA_CG001407, isoform A [Clunio marinus]|uniref:CLUMA_CG001407, isoform A n=1 Tax=Clunio marinus TaxID=568069 RepID=A0A1J1HI82_9DIPT|nr:CLUMA_CG001407, isoform A [Clunio marinus]